MNEKHESSPSGVRRRTVLIGAAAGVGALAASSATMVNAEAATIDRADAATTGEAAVAAATTSSRVLYNFNIDWKFIQQDVANANTTAFDDSAWKTVSVPHTFNDVDSFDEFIGSSGETHVDRRIVWYRKHFTMPANLAGQKVLLEIEGIRQAATVYVNGTKVGLYEFGVTPFGFDVTSAIVFGAANVIAVKADNSNGYLEVATATGFEWDSRDFNPTYGGLTRDVRLHVLPKTYFTLPLYSNLKTVGTYVYASNFSVATKTAMITAEAQVRNEQTTSRTVTVAANIIDASGATVATLTAPAVALGAGQTQIIKVSGTVANLNFWSTGNPYLYTVEMVLSDGATVVDAYPIRTGFRKTEFRGGATNGGVYINDKYIFLSGYAQRATNEWPILGGAVPEWLRDYDGQLVRASKAELIRWMHISSEPANIRFTDKYGIVSVQPAGDKESDKTGRQWDQRTEVMRDSMIYFRNSPSILFWEAGNQYITAAHMAQMTSLRKTWDPHGGRVAGCRAISDDPAFGGTATVDAAEYVGTMLNRHYSVYARDKMPIIECEYTRDEAPRRVWDDFSPPNFGYKPGPDVTYNWNSEQFASTLAASTRFEFWGQRIQGPGDHRYSGAAALCWTDSNQHGRQYNWECCRLSGRVDGVRIPKESYYTFRVMQSDSPDIHVVGHWSYPAGTKKTIYVMAANVAKVSLLVNGTSVASSTKPTNDFLYTFANVTWKSGTVTAVGYDASGKELVRAQKETAGAAAAIKLTATTAPGGLRADGTDVVMIDVEVVDAQGRRVPTDEARVDFTLTGPGKFLGGFNPGTPGSVFKSFVKTECGINRVFARASRTAGMITVKATRSGLTSGTVSVTSSAFTVSGGLTTVLPDLR